MTPITNTEQRQALPAALISGLARYLSAPGEASSRLLDEYVSRDEDNQRAFAVYLLYVHTTDALSRSLIDDCDDAFIGKYDNWQDARDHLAGVLEWHHLLDHAALEDNAGEDVTDLLAWDENAVRKRLHTLFHIVHLDDDTVYVFDRTSDGDSA